MKKPIRDYVLIEVIKEDTGVVKSGDTRDSLFMGRKGKVLAVGPGVYEYGVFVKTTVEVGKVYFWEEAGESNTPEEIRKLNLALIKESRLICEDD